MIIILYTMEDFEKALQRAYEKNKGKITLNGFRKGKVPRQMIEKVYGAGIFYEDAANDLIPGEYSKAAEESKLDIVSQPEIDVTQIEKGKSFIFTAQVALKPEVTLGEYKGVEIEKCDVKVTAEELKELEGLEDNDEVAEEKPKPRNRGNNQNKNRQRNNGDDTFRNSSRRSNENRDYDRKDYEKKEYDKRDNANAVRENNQQFEQKSSDMERTDDNRPNDNRPNDNRQNDNRNHYNKNRRSRYKGKRNDNGNRNTNRQQSDTQ